MKLKLFLFSLMLMVSSSACAVRLNAPKIAVGLQPAPISQASDCTKDSSCSVSFTWTANEEPDLAGYKLHWGNTSGTYTENVAVGNVTTYQLKGLGEGPWFFAITAVNTAGAESEFSDELWVPENWVALNLVPAPVPAQ